LHREGEDEMKAATPENQSQGILEIVGPDLDALLGFYLSIGFVLERRTGDFAVVHWHGQRLFLAGNPDAPVRDCWGNLRIMVNDVDALWRQANRLQLKVGTAIGDRYYGLRDFVLVDPAGFGLRFAQVLA
jgi:glyoxalase/bleomycin resistance protein/dioxygenase superfamily protein